MQAHRIRRHHAARVSGSRPQLAGTSLRGVIEGAPGVVRMIRRVAMAHAYEMALIVSVAALAPLRLVGGAPTPQAVRCRRHKGTPYLRRIPCCSCTAFAAQSQAGPSSPEALQPGA